MTILPTQKAADNARTAKEMQKSMKEFSEALQIAKSNPKISRMDPDHQEQLHALTSYVQEVRTGEYMILKKFSSSSSSFQGFYLRRTPMLSHQSGTT